MESQSRGGAEIDPWAKAGSSIESWVLKIES